MGISLTKAFGLQTGNSDESCIPPAQTNMPIAETKCATGVVRTS